MANREIISNGLFDNDTNAETIRLSWDKVNRMTKDLFNKVETITTTSNINLSDLVGTDNDLPQNGKSIIIDNGSTNITVLVDSSDKNIYNILKVGTGEIEFTINSGRTGVAVSGSLTCQGLPGSKINILSHETTDYINIDDKVTYSSPSATGLETVTENGNTGYRLIGKSPGDNVTKYYTGNNTLDFGNVSGNVGTDYPSFPRGAKSQGGINLGDDNKDAASYSSIILGGLNQTSAYAFSTMIGGYNNAGYGYGDVLIGSYNTTNPTNVNSFLFAMGHNVNVSTREFAAGIGLALKVNAKGQVAVGTSNVPWTGNEFASNRPAFTVGTGTTNSPAGRWETTSEKDGLNVLFSGEVIADSLTETLIDNEATGKVLITKEWANSNFNSITSNVIEAPKTFEDNRDEVTPFYSEDFSTGFGDFTTSGDEPWIIVTNEGSGDLFSARSGDIDDLETSILTLVKTTTQEYTKLEFDYKTSTELDYDFLYVSIDGVIDTFSGTTDWSTESIYIKGIGSHTIEFRYVKDTASDGGVDKVWVDNIKLINEEPAFLFKQDINLQGKLVSEEGIIAKDDIYSHGNFVQKGKFLSLRNFSTTNRELLLANTFNQASISLNKDLGQAAFFITSNLTRNIFQIKKFDGSEGVDITFSDPTWVDGNYESGYLRVLDNNFKVRLGENVGNDTDTLFVANGKGIFRDKLTVQNAVESWGETSNKETLTGSTYNVDWETFGNHDITLTQNTTITQSNIPPIGVSKTITMYFTGEFSLDLPVEWVIQNGGSYVGDVRTQVVIQSWDNGNYQTAIN